MNSLFVHFFVSGNAFFAGILMTIISIFMTFYKGKTPCRISCRLLFTGGFIFVILSGTPIYMPLAVPFYILPLSLMVLLYFDSVSAKLILSLKIISVLLCLAAGITELFNCTIPELPRINYGKIYVIGDSISAGIGFKGEKTWSEIVEEKTRIPVCNMSRGGGTVKSAQTQARLIKDSNILIFLEIGGNDMLGRTPFPQYRKELDNLLEMLKGKNRTLVMLELPCVPFHGMFCKAQRELAAKHKVILIPKRVFAWVLKGHTSTVDGIHLSNYGQEKMAQAFLNACGHALKKPQGNEKLTPAIAE